MLSFEKRIIASVFWVLLKSQIIVLLNEDMSKCTAQKMKFSIKDFSSKFDQIRRKLQIWSHLLEKSLMENFISNNTLSIVMRMACSANDGHVSIHFEPET